MTTAHVDESSPTPCHGGMRQATHSRRTTHVGSLCVAVALLIASAAAAETVDGPSWTLTLALTNALPDRPTMTVRLACRGERILGGFATVPSFNSRAHDVDVSALTLQGSVLAGRFGVTLNPDPWVPSDGRPIPCVYTINTHVQMDNRIAGTFKGWYGKGPDGKGSSSRKEPPLPVAGTLTGVAAPTPEATAFRRIKVRLFHPLIHMWDYRKQTWPPGTSKYAMDMWLAVSFKSGKPCGAIFENTNPDYRGYSALVKETDLRLDGCTLTGTVVVDFENGSQGSGGDPDKRYAQLKLALHGWVMDNIAAGVYDCTVGDDHVEGFDFMGDVTYDSPPDPAHSRAFIRLHGAMRNAWTVFLNLSLNTSGTIHGSGYAPRMTHQIQAVEAGNLKLTGNRLSGRVVMPLYGDSYQPAENFNTSLTYDIDATLDGYAVTGTFKGVDEGKPYTGPITGELRPKGSPEPYVTPATLARCDIQPHRTMVFRYSYEDGRPTGAEVVDPDGHDLLHAKVTDAALALDGDRVTGSIAFTVVSGSASPGEYAYTFDASMDGDRLIDGFWRATHNGNPIYVKSAKLSGKVVKAGKRSTE